MKSTHRVKISVGASTILMIFVVLCFTTFAVLSFLTARSDLEMTKKSATATMQYYQADARMEELIASMDEYLLRSWNSANQYLQNGSFDNLPIGEITQETKNKITEVKNNSVFTNEQKLENIYFVFINTLVYQYPDVTIQSKSDHEKILRCVKTINDNYQIQLQLLVNTQNTADERYRVITRKLVSIKQWNEEEFELWNES